jgi:hypothetical protein
MSNNDSFFDYYKKLADLFYFYMVFDPIRLIVLFHFGWLNNKIFQWHFQTKNF